MCEVCHRKEERDARFWRTVRRALLMMAKAIEARYADGKQDQRAA